VKKTGKNEEFEIFDLGCRLYFLLCNQKAYSSYSRFTNDNKKEKLIPLENILPNIDENIVTVVFRMLDIEEKRALV